MTKLVFSGEAVRALYEHAKASAEHSPTFGMSCDPKCFKPGVVVKKGDYASPDQIDYTKVPAHLKLVKDEGCYLMSSGMPGLPSADGKRNHVVYARGFEAGCDWDALRAALGGDDFAEGLTLDAFDGAMADGAKKIWVSVTSRSISVSWERTAPSADKQAPRVRPTYNKLELARVHKEAGATTKAQWATAGFPYKGVIVEVGDVLVYQKVRRGIVVHERALLPTPIPAKGSMASYVYPQDVNAPATFATK